MGENMFTLYSFQKILRHGFTLRFSHIPYDHVTARYIPNKQKNIYINTMSTFVEHPLYKIIRRHYLVPSELKRIIA